MGGRRGIKYLMPGLADMHGHLTHRGPEQTYPLETFPLLLVAHGVTTLRNMAGYSAILSLRQQIEAGTTLGPQVFTTGPVLEGRAALTSNIPTTSVIGAAARAPDQVPQIKFIDSADEATAEVRQQARNGYNAIKVYNEHRGASIPERGSSCVPALAPSRAAAFGLSHLAAQ